jgi:hypothetical protein
MNGLKVTRLLACSAIGAVVNFDNERTIVFLLDSLDRACLKTVVVSLAFFRIDVIRHTTSVEHKHHTLPHRDYGRGEGRYVTPATQACAGGHNSPKPSNS